VQKDYSKLSPDLILDAIESQGFHVNLRTLALNSYENRVYQIGLEVDDTGIESDIIAKFYRPERWTDEQILEEHQFAKQLSAEEIPVIAPIENTHGESLFEYQGFRFALFPKAGGYSPEPGDLSQLERLGVLLARIHQYGQNNTFQHRDSISIEKHFIQPSAYLIEYFIPKDILELYQEVIDKLQEKITQHTSNLTKHHFIKCHGDWHLGNILWQNEQGGHIVDLDDCVNAPAIQDIWMMLSGTQQEQSIQLQAILKGYEQFCFFDYSELNLLESLRTMRIITYSAWLAKRWDDPAFPKNFPWFNNSSYWQQHLRELQDQVLLIDSHLLKID